MRTRNPTYSLSSSALDELSQILWQEQQQQMQSSDDDDDDNSGSDNNNADSDDDGYGGCAGSSVADSICSIDTLPRLSMGRVRPASAASNGSDGGGGIQLGRVRLRLRRRRRRRLGRAARSPDRRVYRLPQSLRPSSMFDLKLRYTVHRRGGRNIAGDHNKYMQSAGKRLTPPLHPGNQRSCRHVAGENSEARLRFPFSPSLSSLAVSSDAHYFCFASHLSDMISPQQGLLSAPAVGPGSSSTPAPGSGDRTAVATEATAKPAAASSCRCTQSSEGGRPHTTPCLQCYFRCNVVPRRGQFVHTHAGPVLDLASCPPSQPPSQPHTAPALTASWSSLGSPPNRSTGAMSDPENASAASLLMQIRLSQRPLVMSAAAAAIADAHPSDGNTPVRASLGTREAAMVSLVSSLVTEHALGATAVAKPITACADADSPACRPPSPLSCSSSPGSSLRSFDDAPSSMHRPPHHTDSLIIPESPPILAHSHPSGPSYLRLPETTAVTAPTIPADPACDTGGDVAPSLGAATETNHLLLSGVDAAFVPERVFNHHRRQQQQQQQPADNDDEGSMRSRSASIRGFSYGQRTRRSPSNVPPPLVLDGVERTPERLKAEPDTLSELSVAAAAAASPDTLLAGPETPSVLAAPAEPLSAQSEAISFRTALSSLSAPASPVLPASPVDQGELTDECDMQSYFDDDLAEDYSEDLADVTAPEPVERPEDKISDASQSPVIPGPTSKRRASIMQMVMALESGAASPAVSLSASGELYPSPHIPSSPSRYDFQDTSGSKHQHQRIVQEISPLSQKSVPVVVQARRARHPVYRFGALANETFERGRHQDAYDLYSWALELLSPPQGTTAQEIIDRPDVRKQLARLGWQEPAAAGAGAGAAGGAAGERNSAVSFGLFSPTLAKQSRSAGVGGPISSAGPVPYAGPVSSEGPISPSSAAGAAMSAPQSPVRASASLNASTGSLSLRRISEAWVSVNEAEVVEATIAAGAQAQPQPQSAGRRMWNALSLRVGKKAAAAKPSAQQPMPPLPPKQQNQDRDQAVVINEPLPENLAQTPSGKYTFSAEMLEQLKHRPPSAYAIDSDSESDADDSGDPWAMAEGDEKAEISALLFSNRSAAAYALGKYAAAASDATKSVELRDAWAKGHFRRGEALLALGRIRDAYVAYRRAASLDPNDMQIRVSCERARIMAQNDEMGLRVVQLLAGRDFALRPRGPLLHPIRTRIFEFAAAMQNYVYLIADAETRKCIVVDACWDVDGIMAVIERENLLLAAAAVTHGHFDHIGGVPPPPFSSLHIRVSGVAELKRRLAHLPLLVHPLDIPEVMASNPALKSQHFTPTPNGFSFKLGERTDIQFLHTPGHTPGSQCLMVNSCRLFSGDTLFPGSCGRVDLKGGSLDDMVESLQTRLRAVPDSTIVYPGHEYGGEWTSIGREKKRGFLRHVGHGSAQEKWDLLDPKRQCCSG
ncbi:hypothetical protein IWW50_000089 [Coemansia erecta]|nr:hypothetical protein IWW50_000089 [Coemansia erecta]